LCATPEDLEKIYGALTVNENGFAFQSFHEFSSAIIAASHNQLLSEIYKFLYTLLEHVPPQFPISTAGTIILRFRFHLDIYTAIREGNSAAAEKLMREHLASEQTYLKAVMASKQHGKLQVTD
jgi:DNA-binding FadR family transcriptional regulator